VDPPRPVHKVTIVPTGRALGYMLHIPEEERYTASKEELIDQMMVALGGRAAEELVFGKISTGASNDLEKVTAISRAMIFDYGMGATVRSLALQATNYALSEKTKELRDSEQQDLTNAAYDAAMAMLVERRDELEIIAQALLERESLEQEEIEELLGVTHIADAAAKLAANGAAAKAKEKATSAAAAEAGDA
jgi:cell division protease FtsH